MAHAREDECPLCCEEFSVQDKNFRPCQCGYEVSNFYLTWEHCRCKE
jgi:CCR4-NOT transcription complex subunit 4